MFTSCNAVTLLFNVFGTSSDNKSIKISKTDKNINNTNFDPFVALQANMFDPIIGPNVRANALMLCETPFALPLISDVTELFIKMKTEVIAVTTIQIETPITNKQ